MAITAAAMSACSSHAGRWLNAWATRSSCTRMGTQYAGAPQTCPLSDGSKVEKPKSCRAHGTCTDEDDEDDEVAAPMRSLIFPAQASRNPAASV